MSIINIDLSPMAYKIHIKPLSPMSFNTKIAIITNPKISGLHISYLLKNITAKEIHIITINDGEKYKNMQTVDFILEQLFNYKFDRDSTLIAFGGGIVGDITGFTASIYQRGIDYIQIPTTLLSQVDSSVGGKTGINNTFGKNLIGTFNQPNCVYIDTHFLSTLDIRETRAGIAEIIKMAICFDHNFFEFIKNNNLNDISILQKTIQKSVEIKARVVTEDEKEKGQRAKLNYGHTFGHIIENQTNYTKYLHGEAVSIGIIMANKLALSLGLISKQEDAIITKILQKYELPTYYKIDNIDEFYKQFFLDKKTKNQKLKFILPLGIGNSAIKEDIDEKIIKNILRNFNE